MDPEEAEGPATTSPQKAHEAQARSSQALPPTGGVASREAGRDWEQQRVSPAPSGGRFCSSGSTWYRTEPRSDGNPPPSYGDRDLHHGPAGDRCLQLEIAVSSRGWLESPSPFLLYVLTKTFREVYTYICQPNVVVKWASHPSAVS